MIATYKKIEKHDIEILVAMMRDFYAIDGYQMNDQEARDLFMEFITNENLGRAWLIIADESIVGYVILTFVFSFEYKGKIAFLDELYIAERARGKGIGKETIQFIKAQVQILSLKMVYLEVENHNVIAQQLYLSNGFDLHNRKFLSYKTQIT